MKSLPLEARAPHRVITAAHDRAVRPAPVRVRVVSSIPLYADLLAAELSRYAHLDAHACNTADDAHDAQVLLVEVRGMDAAVLLRRWRDRCPQATIVAFGVEEGAEEVLACIEAGAVAYVPRTARLSELVVAAERASRGEASCAPAIAGELFRRVASLARGRAMDTVAAALLTPREREVADMIARGLSNKEIARRLGVRPATVKTHVHQVLRKLGRTSRLSLLAGRA